MKEVVREIVCNESFLSRISAIGFIFNRNGLKKKNRRVFRLRSSCPAISTRFQPRAKVRGVSA
jgi:hypothetical protein